MKHPKNRSTQQRNKGARVERNKANESNQDNGNYVKS